MVRENLPFVQTYQSLEHLEEGLVMTIDSAALAPLTKTVEVPCSVERAFELFTGRLGEWWPLKTHSVGQEAAQTVEMQPRVGGQIVETIDDGRTSVWGTLSAWDPPRGVRFSWHPGQPPEEATDVEVTFEVAGAGTRVTLVHSGWGNRPDGSRARPDYDTGWDSVLGRFTGLAG
jgi:hypothetical protein